MSASSLRPKIRVRQSTTLIRRSNGLTKYLPGGRVVSLDAALAVVDEHDVGVLRLSAGEQGDDPPAAGRHVDRVDDRGTRSAYGL